LKSVIFHDLDLGSGHTAYLRISLIDLYLNTKFRSNRKKLLWTDVWIGGGQTLRPKKHETVLCAWPCLLSL